MKRLSILLFILFSCQRVFPAVYASQTSLTSFEQVKSQNGQIMVRFEMRTIGPKEPILDYKLTLDNGAIDRISGYFFEAGKDQLRAPDHAWTCKASDRYTHCMPMNAQDVDVVVAWLNDASAKSKINLVVGDQLVTVTPGQLFKDQEYRVKVAGIELVIDLLLDKEIGELDVKSVGIQESGDNYDFIIFADTHAGENFNIVNGFMTRIIKRVNNLDPAPAFVVDIGDLVTAQGETEHFKKLTEIVNPLQAPFLMLMGNHESKYRSDFYPGYNLEAFADYFATQKKINGMHELLYSFNVGKWHFIVMPDPKRNYFYEKHPHYFDWLEQDLAKHKDRPTMVFQHIHSLPLGINPMTSYINTPQAMSHFIDALAKYGNVKYLFSGHTHIPLKSAFKTAMQYRGIQFLNLPASSNFPRNFGEPDLRGENSRGYTIAHVSGGQLDLQYQMIDGDLYDFPEHLPEFGPAEWPLWFSEHWQLPVTKGIVNGSFEQGLTGWAKQYVYLEDEDPSNVRRTTFEQADDGAQSLYLYTRKRGYDVEGDNRMTQTLNTLCQAVKVPVDGYPLVEVSFMPDGRVYNENADAGSYILVDGYRGSSKKLQLIYWIGKGYFKPRGLWSSNEPYINFDISAGPDQWHRLAIDVAGDYNDHHESKYSDLGLDRLVVQLGTWNLNQRTGDAEQDRAMQTGVYWDDIQVTFPNVAEVTQLDGVLVGIKPEDEIESRWLMGGMGNERSKK